MRIRTDDNHAWRRDLYDDAAEALGEGSRTAGLDAAAELVLELRGKPGVPGDGALGDLPELLEDPRIPDDVAGELAEVLSVGPWRIAYEPAESRLEDVEES